MIGIGHSSIKPALGKAVEFYTDKVKKYHNAFSDMNKYIDHIEDKLDCANERIVLLEGTVDDLKFQLQQQALPVVPEFVGLGISEDIQLNTVVADVLTTVITSDDKDLKEYGLWIKENLDTYVIARTLGYQVEKPQLFYLKSKSLLENEGESEEPDVDELYLNAKGNLVIYKGDAKKFTQLEIDNMDAGSYEQIKVEVEK